jgi:hypothetical protein
VEVPGGLERFEGPAQHDDGVDQIVPERRMQVRHPARMVCVSLPLCMSLCMSFCMPMVCSASHIPTHTDACRAELHALSIRCMPCRPECLADLHALQNSMPLRSLITCNCPCLVAFLAYPFGVFPRAVMADLSKIICVPPRSSVSFCVADRRGANSWPRGRFRSGSRPELLNLRVALSLLLFRYLSACILSPSACLFSL